MKGEALVLLGFLAALTFAYCRRFSMDMSVLVDPRERSIARITFAIIMIAIGVLIGCVLRLAQ